MDSDQSQYLLSSLLREMSSRCAISPEIAKAFMNVPRHYFVPDASPESVYADNAVVVKYDESPDGRKPLVSSSQPSLMARMLEMLNIKSASNVLEIGTGTGYNAALIANLVRKGFVTSIDIESIFVEHARTVTNGLRLHNIEFAVADGWRGFLKNAPYDRIIVTTTMNDVPAWVFDQLLDGGIIVIPLSIQNQRLLIAMTKRDGKLRTTNIESAYFVDARGERFNSSMYWLNNMETFIDHDTITGSQVETLMDILHFPFNAAPSQHASEYIRESKNDLRLYFALNYWLSIGLTHPSLTKTIPVVGNGRLCAIVNLEHGSVALPEGYFGSQVAGKDIDRLCGEFSRMNAPTVSQYEFCICPKNSKFTSKSGQWNSFGHKADCDIFWRLTK
jgi:protein-L-isoaspartate(D-aspartate) O-methyltransferase